MISGFSEDVRQIAGFQLWRVQCIHAGTEHRVIYVARFAEAVYVLHAFEKRTRRTPKEDLDLARQRLRSLINQRIRKG